MAEKKTKTRKTPLEIAQERLGVAERKVKALTVKWEKAKADAEQLGKERDEAVRRYEFLGNDPALVVEADLLEDPDDELDHDPADPEAAGGDPE